jgi:hypothetical protein
MTALIEAAREAAASAMQPMRLAWHCVSEQRRELPRFRRHGRTRPMPRPLDRGQRRQFRGRWSCLPLPVGVILEVADD